MDKKIREMIERCKDGLEVKAGADVCVGEGVKPRWVEDRGQLVINPPPLSKCTKCGGSGYNPERKNGYAYAMTCRGGKLRDLAARSRWANIPAAYAESTIDNVHQAIGEVARTILPGDKGLWLHGPPGTGKTYAAIGMCKVLVVRHRVRFQPMMDLLGEIKKSYSNPDISEDEIINKISSFPFLVLDDIGQFHRGGEFELRILFEIFDRRLRAGGTTTIVTSNPPPKEMDGASDWHGQRIVSRLHALTYPVAMSGKDMRKN